ncbi:GMC oxidoreductase [Blastococcus sp. CCUG 61487]|uniref:GMC oxidoreductase n=1 Tax=Blastococcus sp. CCUG 61487 TaxID=1840703 RepID=UPI0010BFBA36|nr:GMC oxidoreductase [Blastococcus sp. CCUG 61487]
MATAGWNGRSPRSDRWASVLGEDWSPGAAAQGHEALRAEVRETLESLCQPVSYCRMGTDDAAVVDSKLRVDGIEELRVAVASVMPTLMRGRTNLPSTMIGERSADLILGRTSAVAAASPQWRNSPSNRTLTFRSSGRPRGRAAAPATEPSIGL